MDQSSVHTTPAEEDEWDTEGFVIPSLGIEDPDQNITDAPKLEDPKPSYLKDKSEEIYLGPHGAPPQSKQEPNPSGRKQRFKQKLKEAEWRSGSGTGRENKVESLRELIGGGKYNVNMGKGGSPTGWLDPHCNESQFERRHPQ
ncbi:hypothetical protein Nepgr_007647 [Nepenthes gracilis]|uniref:Uncharacterized protein n=1 Tax=Nepenthes gracilis TaxID=150966 RepID=A0AAD3S862_NEPGR|nr:hypothetical protein Nepgr_007647 [Nepenthes gracilis]